MLQNYLFHGFEIKVPYLLLMCRPWKDQISFSDESMSFLVCPSIGLHESHDDRRFRGRLPDVFFCGQKITWRNNDIGKVPSCDDSQSGRRPQDMGFLFHRHNDALNRGRWWDWALIPTLQSPDVYRDIVRFLFIQKIVRIMTFSTLGTPIKILISHVSLVGYT